MDKHSHDFQLQNEGSIVLLRPLTKIAKEWIEENLAPDVQMFGNAAAIEPRYLEEILHGILQDGLCIS